MYKKALIGLVTVFAVTGLGGVASATQPVNENQNIVREQPVDLHCPDHNTGEFPKISGDNADEVVEVGGVMVQVVTDGKDVNFYDSEGDPLVVVFCVKGGNELTNTGKLTGASYTHTQDVSYVVVYEVPTEEPEEPEEPTPVTPEETDEEDEQVDAPVAAVNAGGGTPLVSAIALVASVGALGYGLVRSRN